MHPDCRLAHDSMDLKLSSDLRGANVLKSGQTGNGQDKYFATSQRYLTGEVAAGAPRGETK